MLILLLLLNSVFLQTTEPGGGHVHPDARVTDFTLQTMSGGSVRYSSIRGQIVVVIFISTRCPISNAFNSRMNELYLEFGNRVQFLFVNSNANESIDEVREHARTVEYDFQVYKDNDGVVADLFGAEATPDAFLLDSTGTVRYHGYIEDRPNPERAKHQALRAAIQALLAGAPDAVPETHAFGCAIRRARLQKQ